MTHIQWNALWFDKRYCNIIKFLGVNDHLDNDVLIFNRVPKTGSENMAYVIKELSAVNNFTHIRYGNPDHRLISRKEQVRQGNSFSI